MRTAAPAALLALGLALVLPGRVEAQAEEQLRQAIRRYENLEIDRARAMFQQVISPSSPFPVTEPQRVIAYKYLGATLATEGQRDSAITYFIAAIQRDPLVDLEVRSFSEQERQVFAEAKRRLFRIGLQPVPRDTIDPQTERVNLTVATTHLGTIRVEVVSTFDDGRYVLFEGDVDGPRDVPFNGLSRTGTFVPPGAYDLVVLGVSRLDTDRSDSASTLIEIGWDRAALEDTIVTLAQDQLLPERQPASAATRDLVYGLGIAAGALLASRVIGQTDLEGSQSFSLAIAGLGVGAGIYAYVNRRNHPEIPANVTENMARQARRARANQQIMERNTARINATKIIIRPLGQ